MSATEDAKAAAERARTELAAALDAIDDKFDVKSRINDVGQGARDLGGRAVELYKKNPVPWIVAGAAIAVVAVGLVAWAIFSPDEDD